MFVPWRKTLKIVIRNHALKILRYIDIVRSLRSSTQVINLSLVQDVFSHRKTDFRLFYTIKRYSLEKKNQRNFPSLVHFPIEARMKFPFNFSFTYSWSLSCASNKIITKEFITNEVKLIKRITTFVDSV